MGFFYQDNGKSKRRSAPKEMPIELMHDQKCRACPRKRDWGNLGHPKMKPTGARRKDCLVYFLGEAPGENEDRRGRQFIGKSGEHLRENIPGRFLKYTRWNNTIRCRPPNNRDPLPAEIECCRKLQEQDIVRHKPKVVVLVGSVPTNWLFPGSGQGIYAWRGRFVPAQIDGFKFWAYPILHPSGVLRKQAKGNRKSEEQKVFERDLRVLFRKLSKDQLGTPDVRNTAEIDSDISWVIKGDLADIRKVERQLEKMARARISAVDIETRNLRPYHPDSRILSCSITTKAHGTFAFPLDWEGFWRKREYRKRAFRALHRFLLDSGRKVCHNTSFELEWFAHKFGKDIILKTRWADTMAQAYCLDSRKGMLSLDMLCRLYFSIDLKAASPNIDRKRIWTCALKDVLPYNGMDTKWTLELYESQRKIVRREKLSEVVAERVRTGQSLVGAMLEGVPANEATADLLTEEINDAIEDKLEEARKTRAWKKFVAKYGRDPGVDSHPDMEKLWGGIMNPPECRTEKGGITTADDVLKTLSPSKYPLAPIIIDIRSLTTIRGTFLGKKIKSQIFPDGRLHTNYGHLYTSTGRTNSEDPNLQNWVKHGEWKKIRAIVEHSESGLIVISFDYGQIEARVIAMASQDPVFVQMLWDKYDVHMEWAERVHDEWKGCLKPMGIKEGWKNGGAEKYRQEIKNRWVFPLFFGSIEYSVARNLQMPEHVAGFLFEEFWETFEGIKEWQKELISRYDRVGYVETLTGRRRYAPISYNEQINMPVQGTASDIVVDAGYRLMKKGIQFNLNMHDDLTFVMKNSKRKIEEISREMCRPNFDFINVPLVVEVEAGDNWYEQKKIAEYASNVDFNFH